MHRRFPSEGFDLRALQASEKSRSRSILETLRLTEANFTKDADPETVKREKEIRSLLNAKADSLTDLLSRNSDQTEIQKISNDIHELSNELEQIKANLKQNSPVYSAIQNPPPFDIGEFQNQILVIKRCFWNFLLVRTKAICGLSKKRVFRSHSASREKIEPAIQKLRELLDSRETGENESVADYHQD